MTVLTLDYEQRPAQFSTAITASATALAQQTPPVVFRALRFGSPTAGTTGTITVTYAKADGTAGDAGVVEAVAAGEVWSRSSASIYAITAISGITVRGEG